MKNSRVFTSIFITGLFMPVLLLFTLAYNRTDVLKSIFSSIPMVPRGTYNSRFMNKSLLLNSTSVYLGSFFFGFLSALVCTPTIKARNYVSEYIIYIALCPLLMIFLFIVITILKSPNDLALARKIFRALSTWYFLTCIYYAMAIVFFYFLIFVPVLMFISLPVKAIILSEK